MAEIEEKVLWSERREEEDEVVEGGLESACREAREDRSPPSCLHSFSPPPTTES